MKTVFTPVEERFWSKVNKNGDGGCWVWIGAKTKGYGHIRGSHGKSVLAHRAAWEIMVGPIPDGFELDHKCHNPSCVNPEHLRLASHAENTRNTITPSSNTSGYKGVSWSKDKGKWRADISVAGRRIILGFFLRADLAHRAYVEAAVRYHGGFANGGDHP